jgi:thiamine biosynthesis lipoprotein
VTIKPLVDLWKAAAKNNALPTAAEIERARALVGYDKIVLDASERSITFLKDGMGIDLGGVAKGYAADRAAKMLRDNGIFDAVVSCGSGMYCMGKKSDGKPWRIGIRHPRHKGSVVFELSVTDKGVDTSGDYEKCFVINGKRYSHIIDPRSGYPAEGASSATVIADSSVIADIMATASCIIGRSALDALAGSVDEEAVLLYVDGISLKVSMTKGALEKYDIREKVF